MNIICRQKQDETRADVDETTDEYMIGQLSYGKVMVLPIHTRRSFEEMCHGIAPRTPPKLTIMTQSSRHQNSYDPIFKALGIKLSQIGRSGPTYIFTPIDGPQRDTV
jgi:hypothetical protein